MQPMHMFWFYSSEKRSSDSIDLEQIENMEESGELLKNKG